jgi:hypothetical protein
LRTLPLLTLLLGCSNQQFNRAMNSDEFQQAPSNQVDILWVIDNSVSMLNEQKSVAAGADDFISHIEDTDIDFHLGVINTDVDFTNPNAGVLLGTPNVLTKDTPNYADAFRSYVMQGNTGSDQEKGLQAALMALSSPMAVTVNDGFMREGAMTSIIVLSDENDCSDLGALGGDSTGEECYTRASELAPVTDLVRSLAALKPNDPLVLSGIVGPEIVDDCEATVPGRRYYTAIEILGGVQADICSTDYSAIMSSLGEIASGILTIFQLTKAAVEDTIEVTVTPEGGEAATVLPICADWTTDTECDAENGWSYHADYAQIEFHGTAIPPRGALIEVKYQVAGQVETVDTGDTASP